MKNIETSAHEVISQLLLGSGVVAAICGFLFKEELVLVTLNVARECSTYFDSIAFYIASNLS